MLPPTIPPVNPAAVFMDSNFKKLNGEFMPADICEWRAK